MNKKIIIRISYLIIIITIFCGMKNYVSEKIIGNEITREQNDIQVLLNLQELFKESLKQNDVEQLIRKMLGNKESCKLLIGRCKDDVLDNIQKKYKVIYENIDINSFSGEKFLSLNCNKNGILYVYINKDLEVIAVVFDEDEKILKSAYTEQKMIGNTTIQDIY